MQPPLPPNRSMADSRAVTTDLNWHRSSYCSNGTCVEVATTSTGTVLLRDGKNPDQPPLAFTRDQWAQFLQTVRDSNHT